MSAGRHRNGTSSAAQFGEIDMREAISTTAAAELIPDGSTLLIGGFMGGGSPLKLIDALVCACRLSVFSKR